MMGNYKLFLTILTFYLLACEICDEWFHFDCVGYIGSMELAESLDFICKFCDSAEGDYGKSQERKKRFGHLFKNFDDSSYNVFSKLWGNKDVVPFDQPEEEKISAEEDNSSRKADKYEGDSTDEPPIQKKLKIDVEPKVLIKQNTQSQDCEAVIPVQFEKDSEVHCDT